MSTLGIGLFIITWWAWFWPESAGRWLARARAAYDAERRGQP